MRELQKVEAGLKMNMRWIAICLLIGLAGCEPGTTPPPTEPMEAPEVAVPQTTEISTKVMDYAGIQMLIESYRGKVVVVDYWSTNCQPCIKELPGLVKLHKAYPTGDVKCITVSLDYIGLADEGPETYHDKVMPFLKHVGATFDNIIAADDSDAMLKKLELAAPPAVYVYDRDGKLARRFDNEDAAKEAEGFTYETDVIPLVNELVLVKP